MRTITFYSYKGGVGRSLALSNVANRLAEFGKKVCILDFDLEAPGMHLKFGSYIDTKGIKSGLVDYISAFVNNQIVPKKITDFVTNIHFDEESKKDIALIAAGNTLSKSYWKNLSSINWNELFYNEASMGVEFFYNLKEQIREQIKPDFLLIDSRTGITDISGVTMSIFADEVVLLAANNRENLEGISQVIKTLAIPSNSIKNEVPKINFVLCRIPYYLDPKDKPKETNAKNTALRIINSELTNTAVHNFKIEKALVIHSDPELEMEEQLKISYVANNKPDLLENPIGLDYLELFEELTNDIITKSEKKKFDTYIQIQFLIEKALSTSDLPNKFKLLNSALEIDPKSSEAVFRLGTTYYETKSYQKALDYFNLAISMDPQKMQIKTLVYLGSTHLRLGNLEEAERILENALDLLPKNLFIMQELSHLYYKKKQYKKSLDIDETLLALYPDNESVLNSMGNILRILGKHEQGLEYIYKALEINPTSTLATCTLAELNLELSNYREFYKNLELAFSFGLNSEIFQDILETEAVYKPFFNDEKFLSILEKYNIEVDWSKIQEI